MNDRQNENYQTAVRTLAGLALTFDALAVATRTRADALTRQANEHGAEYLASRSPYVDTMQYGRQVSRDLARAQDSVTDALAYLAMARESSPEVVAGINPETLARTLEAHEYVGDRGGDDAESPCSCRRLPLGVSWIDHIIIEATR